MDYDIRIHLDLLNIGPSETLIATLRDRFNDPSEVIKARLSRLLHYFLQHYRDNAEDKTIELAARCCQEAGIRYYRILQNHVGEEKIRLGLSDISHHLGNDLFHLCLVACCLEIAIFSNRLPCVFPMLLQILGLAPYHFWRGIELVVRAETDLPSTVVSHIAQVEEQVVDELVWAEGSLVWRDIKANEGRLPTCEQVMFSSQLEFPNIMDSQPEGNLLGDGHNSGTEVSGTVGRQPLPSAVNRPQRTKSFHLFARKVYILMGRRLKRLCVTLHFSDELRLKIWTCFEHSLVNFIDLMVDQHLDQLLLCAIYIIVKITNDSTPFKQIMKCYKSQPLIRESAYRNVQIRGRGVDDVTGNNNSGVGILIPPLEEKLNSIIRFYNLVYRIKMEDFAKQFAQVPGVDTPPLSPYPIEFKARPPRRKLTPSHSIYISSYTAVDPPPQTPVLCYYFNSSLPKRLHEINNMISTSRACSRGRYKVSLDEEGDDEEGPEAKRLRVDHDSVLQQQLRAVMNDRMTELGVTNSKLQALTFCQVMGCNTSRGPTVVDPADKPEDRPTTATSTQDASTEGSNGQADAAKDESAKSSS